MTTEEQNDARYPLASDSNGNPVAVPEQAVAWRVRRGGGRRGRPRNVFDPETGRQLEVPLGATLDDLIDAGCPADRYLLYPVDGEGKIVSGIIAVTEIPEGAGDEPVAVESQPDLTRELLATLRASNEALCRALEATTSGYGPVRPAAQAPIVVEHGGNGDGGGGFKPEQIAEFANVAKSMFEMFKGAGGGGAAGGGP